jgi:FixJ family two-component response regulator
MSESDFAVFLVDDDPGLLKALTRLLTAKGYAAQPYTSPSTFLETNDPQTPGCAVIDMAMPEMDGLTLQKSMMEKGDTRPIIFLTGQASVASTVHAMQAGAVDFLEKPVNAQDLFSAVERAAVLDRRTRHETAERKAIWQRYERLSKREREVCGLVIAGALNKQMAYRLGIVEKTIKVHRRRMLLKMGTHTVAELVRMTEAIGVKPTPTA